MADDICAQDRALIAEAIAADRVTRIPRGVSGVPYPVYVNRNGGELTDGPPRHWRATNARFHRGLRGLIGKKAGYVSSEVAARRIRVREARLRGLTYEQIAAVERVTVKTIGNDINALRKRGFAL